MTSFNLKKNFGFGLMRLPMKDGEVDNNEVCAMVDAFLDAGFDYFDTAHGYHSGKSEIAVRECLTSRHPRDRYLLANKLSSPFLKRESDIHPLFEKQLGICGVDYFDFYLLHAQTADVYKKFTEIKAYEAALKFKKEGRARHVGLSFHDKAELLDKILTERPEMEFVQIQFNYADFDDPGIQSRLCYEVCVKHSKPVVVMEPLRGGYLARLPKAAKAILGEKSAAELAIRYAASFKQVFMTLSGMSDLSQMQDNIAFMKDFKPLSKGEFAMTDRIMGILRAKDYIPCTACRYCETDCPQKIAIPDLLSCLNAKKLYHDWNSDWYYGIFTKNAGRARDCTGCGQCETNCPQHLKVRELISETSRIFDKAED